MPLRNGHAIVEYFSRRKPLSLRKRLKGFQPKRRRNLDVLPLTSRQETLAEYMNSASRLTLMSNNRLPGLRSLARRLRLHHLDELTDAIAEEVDLAL